MKLGSAITAYFFSATALAASRSEKFTPLLKYKPQQFQKRPNEAPPVVRRQTASSPFLNANTTKFVVDGTGIPDVDFDVGESYAGSLPVGTVGNSTDGQMFFWFFPSAAEEETKEIIIWLNGGPGCSSLSGMIQENGPFQWQSGTFKPNANPWSWHQLTNVVWVEQPIGTGYSTGTITAQNEDDVAQQFMGFWRNFVDAFGLHGYKIYVTGESYAGLYCPYISSNMLDTNDTTYFNVNGMLIYDPVISSGTAPNAPTNYFVNYWRNVMPFEDNIALSIANASMTCGYDEYTDKYLTFPPSGQQPDFCQQPGINEECDDYLEGCDVFDTAFEALLDLNPGFNIYQVAQLLPVPDDVLGFPTSIEYVAPGREVYFNRTDVKKAIHAPLDVDWAICADEYVFAGDDDYSDPSSYRVIPNVIDRTHNVQIAHATMDMVLLANGSLLAIQNMTWGGQMGFQSQPREPLFAPWHPNPEVAGSSGQGVQGTWHSERGLTWALIGLAGHMVPTWQAAVAFRQVEVLLGRVANLSSTTPFPQYPNAKQPDPSELGFGTAWYGFQDGPSPP
ncbi:carboxypeptidase cpdS [Diaporthe helianthi]|uniref:Carboxypeptidase n=1 Tax=Diaporthe helianthi TaxID=158607 RepID=A0A2P5HL06_DIAHE|nr:carboxypeptidase cpdS [Diaporthe helianthi]